jgi:hypothetical protein
VRTDDEILKRIEELTEGKSDPFGWTTAELFASLTWEGALRSGLLKEGVKEESWGNDRVTDQQVSQYAIEYLSFAIGKAAGHRSLSAARSYSHYQAWMWLLEKYDEVDWTNYAQYGAPILLQIASLLGEDAMKVWSDNSSVGLVRMAEGLPCRSDCEDGCGT